MLCALVQNNLVQAIEDLTNDRIAQIGNSYEAVIDVTDVLPRPAQNWTWNGAVFIPPPGDPANAIILIQNTIVAPAIKFGAALIAMYASENVAMGITQAGKTNAVLSALSAVRNSLQSGSLYDALAEIQNVTIDPTLAPYITAPRMKVYANYIRAYLGLAQV